ncbi:MAG TPA: FHA domain-containing protein [Thermoanaerobaculia bacterium]|nr:FHA domain-containing protein [Thermoanaerobaculia bacterium]
MEARSIEGGEGWFLELEERRVELREGEVTVGRSRSCGVVLRDPSVSRGHALLSVTPVRIAIQDMRSSNGTYLNGRRLEAETELADGDRLVIGETEIYLRRALRPPGGGVAAASSEVLPIGEAGSLSESWERTHLRSGAAASSEPPDAALEPPTARPSELPMSVREAEGAATPPEPRPAVPPASASAPKPGGILSRLAALFRGRG